MCPDENSFLQIGCLVDCVISRSHAQMPSNEREGEYWGSPFNSRYILTSSSHNPSKLTHFWGAGKVVCNTYEVCMYRLMALDIPRPGKFGGVSSM